jgi:hypothetical protein
MDSIQDGFSQAKRTALELIRSVEIFLSEVDGEVKSPLLEELSVLRSSIESLSFDKDTLAAYGLPFPNADPSLGVQGLGYSDARINRLFEGAFPAGHRFHAVNRRRMLHDLAKIKHVAEELRRRLSGGS